MKRFRIVLDVTDFSGSQVFECSAKTKEEAFEIFENGDGEFVDEEVEITGLEDVSLENIEEVKTV